MRGFPTVLLVQLVTEHIDVHPSDVSIRRIPTGKFNTSYYVETPDQSYVLRIAPPDDAGFVYYERGMMAQEPSVHALVRRKSDVPVARILAFDNSRALIGRDYLIMERLPGRALTEVPVEPGQMASVLEQVGRYLRQIHRIRTT